MEQLNYIRGGDTTKKTMVSLGPGPAYKGGQAVRPSRVRVRPLTVLSRPCLGLMREKDIAEHRLKIDSCVASPFQRSVDSVLDRAKATAQSQLELATMKSNLREAEDELVKVLADFAVSKDSAGNVTEDNIKDAISWYKQALGFHVEAGHGVKFTFTNIDAKRPTREFSFTVHYGNDIYSCEYTHFLLKPSIDYILLFTKSLVTRKLPTHSENLPQEISNR
ncbi:hypothetical protein BRARA_F01691 [Brassica rapa]|uniref:Kinetochore protein SPC25 n=1 Tax=Brassica campestris TaxID=3711 RepID=A0A397YY52_BRACM|nr:hypothetical protein BRARA_F01691 [Brassica rapa]